MKNFLIVCIIIVGAAAFWAQKTLPGVMKNLAVKELNNALNTEAEIDDLKVSLWGGIISFSGIRIKNPPGFGEKYFLTVERGYVDIGLSALLSKRLVIDKAVLYSPRLNVEINNANSSNTPLVFKKEPPKAPAASGKPKAKTGIRNVIVQNGVFQLVNYKVNPQGASILFDKIDITATPRKIDMAARLPAPGMNGSIRLEAKGDFISDRISFDADFAAEEISLVYFMPFYAYTAPVIAKSGRFDLRSNARCRDNQLYALQKADIEDLELVVNEAAPGDKTVFGLPILSVVNFFVNTNGRLTFEFDITGTLKDPEFHLGEALKRVLARSIGQAIINRLSGLPGQILERVEESGKIGEASKEALRDILQKVLKAKE